MDQQANFGVQLAELLRRMADALVSEAPVVAGAEPMAAASPPAVLGAEPMATATPPAVVPADPIAPLRQRYKGAPEAWLQAIAASTRAPVEAEAAVPVQPEAAVPVDFQVAVPTTISETVWAEQTTRQPEVAPQYPVVPSRSPVPDLELPEIVAEKPLAEPPDVAPSRAKKPRPMFGPIPLPAPVAAPVYAEQAAAESLVPAWPDVTPTATPPDPTWSLPGERPPVPVTGWPVPPPANESRIDWPTRTPAASATDAAWHAPTTRKTLPPEQDAPQTRTPAPIEFAEDSTNDWPDLPPRMIDTASDVLPAFGARRFAQPRDDQEVRRWNA